MGGPHSGQSLVCFTKTVAVCSAPAPARPSSPDLAKAYIMESTHIYCWSDDDRKWHFVP